MNSIFEIVNKDNDKLKIDLHKLHVEYALNNLE